jgi:hypothetical protein
LKKKPEGSPKILPGCRDKKSARFVRNSLRISEKEKEEEKEVRRGTGELSYNIYIINTLNHSTPS